MVHDFDYKDNKNALLEIPTFKQMLSSLDPKKTLSKPSRANQSFSIMRDLNNHKEVAFNKIEYKRLSSRRNKSKPKLHFKGKVSQ